MKDMGGLYLDLDIECFQHREHMLHGLDLVLQVSHSQSLMLQKGLIAVSTFNMLNHLHATAASCVCCVEAHHLEANYHKHRQAAAP